jgi:hypothetical protein
MSEKSKTGWVALFVVVLALASLLGCNGRKSDAPAKSDAAVVAHNAVSPFYATVSGGSYNAATAAHATVSGGTHNTAGVEHAVVAGGNHNLANATRATVGGGFANKATGIDATVSGGGDNAASGRQAAVGGGTKNTAAGFDATIAGGGFNTASGAGTAVSGGTRNKATGYHATVGGGAGNSASANSATVGGGLGNRATAAYATIAGGSANTAGGAFATSAGGADNHAAADYSFASGRGACVDPIHAGTFLYADATALPFHSAAPDEFAVRATGGVRFVTAVDGAGLPLAGVTLAPGSGAWSSLSARQVKTGVAPMDPLQVLARLAKLPISTWSYVSQDPSIRHLGPTAQDFHAAFGLGEDEQHISTVDADGVSLAAIQALYRLLQAQDAQIAALQTRVADLEVRLAALEETNR